MYVRGNEWIDIITSRKKIGYSPRSVASNKCDRRTIKPTEVEIPSSCFTVIYCRFWTSILVEIVLFFDIVDAMPCKMVLGIVDLNYDFRCYSLKH